VAALPTIIPIGYRLSDGDGSPGRPTHRPGCWGGNVCQIRPATQPDRRKYVTPERSHFDSPPHGVIGGKSIVVSESGSLGCSGCGIQTLGRDDLGGGASNVAMSRSSGVRDRTLAKPMISASNRGVSWKVRIAPPQFVRAYAYTAPTGVRSSRTEWLYW
jgi:hypothetical protein